MGWFNYYGLAIVLILMIPNIVFAIKRKDQFMNAYQNTAAQILEGIGRCACFAFMILNIPYAYFNFWFEHALIVYLSVNGSLLVGYLITFIVLWNKSGKAKALTLSILPSLIFLFSGIMLLHIPLIACSVLFAVCHILISYKNAVLALSEENK